MQLAGNKYKATELRNGFPG